MSEDKTGDKYLHMYNLILKKVAFNTDFLYQSLEFAWLKKPLALPKTEKVTHSENKTHVEINSIALCLNHLIKMCYFHRGHGVEILQRMILLFATTEHM